MVIMQLKSMHRHKKMMLKKVEVMRSARSLPMGFFVRKSGPGEEPGFIVNRIHPRRCFTTGPQCSLYFYERTRFHSPSLLLHSP